MAITVDLTPQEETYLRIKASDADLEPAELVRRLVQQEVTDLAESGKTVGQLLLEKWERDGVLGVFADRPDSPEFVRQLRGAEERRHRCF